ncbi:MAG: hypothetical protein IJ763_05850 [Lachnospiraceae bacterium]|nr:hypothetical protein [Lachnospiraceae bacterium]
MTYELLERILTYVTCAFLILNGVLSLIAPNMLLKKEDRDDPERIAKLKKNAPISLIIGIIGLVFFLFVF